MNPSLIRRAFLACAEDYERAWDVVVAANRAADREPGTGFTRSQDEAYDAFFVVQDEYLRLERALSRIEQP